ncbi:hypothetical protein ACRALDRAFT_1079957 [Sodiomyces alcalophilus JCM 7366]|uniref:uncharacterized protein n=1 Tax=Sodiomyces alcalophilus JCM 7366 TaxID=591952 RepID=UPI0039B3BCFE
MTAAVSLLGQPLSGGSPGSHVNDFDSDDMALTAMHFTVDSADVRQEEVTFLEDSAAAWGEGIAGSTQANTIPGTSTELDMSLDEFLDFNSFAGMGDDHDHLGGLSDPRFFDMAAAEGYTSVISSKSSGDDTALGHLDVDLPSCHPQQLQQRQQLARQELQHEHQFQDHYLYESRQDLRQPVDIAASSNPRGLIGGGCSPGTGSHNDKIGVGAGADAGRRAPPPPPLPRDALALARSQPQSQAAEDQPFAPAATSEGGQRNRNASWAYPEPALGPGWSGGPGGPDSITDSELSRLESISLKASPSRVPPLGHVSLSQPPPTPHFHPTAGFLPPASSASPCPQAGVGLALGPDPGPGPGPSTTSRSTSPSPGASSALAKAQEGGPIQSRRRLRGQRTVSQNPPSSSRNFFKTVASKIQKAATLRSKSTTSTSCSASASASASASTLASSSSSSSSSSTTSSKSIPPNSHHTKQSRGTTPVPMNNDMASVAAHPPISPAVSPRKRFQGLPNQAEQQQQQQHVSMGDPRLPISPPNSTTIPQGISSDTTPFCTGFVEDPFSFAGTATAATTPMDTPSVIHDDKTPQYFQQPAGAHPHGAAQTSKAAWPLTAASSPPTPGDTQATEWSNSFIPPDGLDGTQWWAGSLVDLGGGSHQQSPFQTHNARGAAFNLAHHPQQQQHHQHQPPQHQGPHHVEVGGHEMSYEYHNTQHIPTTPGANHMPDLMIQIPPHGADGRASLSPTTQANTSSYTHVPVPQQPPHQQQQQQQHHQHHHYHHPGAPTERRPRMPRAPSAGTRHISTPLRRTRPSSASRARDSSSTSPTPTPHTRHSSGSSIGTAAAGPVLSASIKKRRSWQGRGASGHHTRTPSGGSSSGLGLGVGLGISMDESGGSGGGGDIGFVNYTPNDKTILMTGVAPSGSSKTKARREKEAQEKRRRLSEAAIKAVRDAGGDVEKLVQEGFVF